MSKRNFLQDEIELIEPGHIYKIKRFPNLDITSATTFIHEFFEKFDSEKVAGELSESSNKKYGHMTQEEIIKQWKQISSTGTKVHQEIEDWILDNSKEPEHQKSKFGVEWLKNNCEPHYKLYPEIKIYSLPLQLAGTVDLLIHEPHEDLWIMADWKTNSRIYEKAYGYKKGKHQATMFLDDCNLNHYTLQMSLYQYILEKEYGIKIHKRVLLHLREKITRYYPEGVKEYWTEYLKSNVEKMAEYRLQQRKQGKLHQSCLYKR